MAKAALSRPPDNPSTCRSCSVVLTTLPYFRAPVPSFSRRRAIEVPGAHLGKGGEDDVGPRFTTVCDGCLELCDHGLRCGAFLIGYREFMIQGRRPAGHADHDGQRVALVRSPLDARKGLRADKLLG